MGIQWLRFFVILLLAFSLTVQAGADLSPVTPPLDKVEQPTRDNGDNNGPTSPSRVLPGEPPQRKNYLIPFLEIPLFELMLNGIDRGIYGNEDYGTTFQTGWDHINHGPWVVDKDVFTVNQIGHPYQGSVYYGLARSSGLNYWESLLYSNYGSFLWEMFGETTDPSINDQVASGIGGSIVGEPLYRMYNLLLERGGDNPGFWRKVGAVFISPPTAFNRLVFGDRYSPILESRHPATFSRLEIGGGVNSHIKDPGSSHAVNKTVVVADYSMDYGLPGKPGYRYLRPFDYFHFEVSGLREGRENYQNVMTRGMLFGFPYESGDNYRGIWGLYGSFDYLSPQVYRVSTTAASLGTTAQWWVWPNVALQGTGLVGLGYGAAGTITPQNDEPDYHYGAAPQGLLALRLIFGKRFLIETTGREYYITTIGANKAPGTEHINRLNASFLVRLIGGHALGLSYLLTNRDARYTRGPVASRHQVVETVSLTYNFIWDQHFGAVSWHDVNTADEEQK